MVISHSPKMCSVQGSVASGVDSGVDSGSVGVGVSLQDESKIAASQRIEIKIKSFLFILWFLSKIILWGEFYKVLLWVGAKQPLYKVDRR